MENPHIPRGIKLGSRSGARFRYTRELGSTTVVNEVEVSAFEPDRTVELTSISGPTPFVYRYRLEPSADGTLLRLEGSISGEGLGGPLVLLKPLAETFFRRGMIANLETLKRLIERDPS
ncbi:MAG: SRPBCC family protein [Thermoanaerobaculia bacterium]